MSHVPRRHVREQDPLRHVHCLRIGQKGWQAVHQHERRHVCAAGLSGQRQGVINPLHSTLTFEIRSHIARLEGRLLAK